MSNKIKLLHRLTQWQFGPPPVRSLKSVASGGVDKQHRGVTFDFWNRGYLRVRTFLDRTYRKMTENSRYITVEGNVAVGKAKFARSMANAFDLAFVPDVNDERMFVNRLYDPPIDYRAMNPILPRNAQFYTTQMFFEEGADEANKNAPLIKSGGRPARLQLSYLTFRHFEHSKAMSYLFNTGQGVVTDRSPFLDIAFADTMRELGLMSEPGHNYYMIARQNLLSKLWQPHLFVYLRCSTQRIMENIAKSNIPWQTKSKVLNKKFVDTLTYMLEKVHFPRLERCSQIYVVDLDEVNLDNPEDTDFLLEDISRVDLEVVHSDVSNPKFIEWKNGTQNREMLDFTRANFSNPVITHVMPVNNFYFPRFIKDLSYTDSEREMRSSMLDSHPQIKYDPNFNPNQHSIWNLMTKKQRHGLRNYRNDFYCGPQSHLVEGRNG